MQRIEDLILLRSKTVLAGGTFDEMSFSFIYRNVEFFGQLKNEISYYSAFVGSKIKDVLPYFSTGVVVASKKSLQEQPIGC